MCNKCNQTKCCCKPKRLNVRGKAGEPGRPGRNGLPGTNGTDGTDGTDGVDGVSAYVYIAYASNVVSGTPDTVTGFSLTTPDCWLAVITNTTPLTPVQADFQGKWKKVCGDSGAGVSLKTVATNPIDIQNGNGNLNTDVSPGGTLTIVTAGTYYIQSQYSNLILSYAALNPDAGNVIWKIKVNGATVKQSFYSLNDFVGTWEITPSTFDTVTLNPGDVISCSIGLYTPHTNEALFTFVPPFVFTLIAFKVA